MIRVGARMDWFRNCCILDVLTVPVFSPARSRFMGGSHRVTKNGSRFGWAVTQVRPAPTSTPLHGTNQSRCGRTSRGPGCPAVRLVSPTEADQRRGPAAQSRGDPTRCAAARTPRYPTRPLESAKGIVSASIDRFDARGAATWRRRGPCLAILTKYPTLLDRARSRIIRST